MAKVMIAEGVITIRFGRWERFFTGRAEYILPVAAVRQAVVAGRPLRVPRGGRRGLTVSGHTKIGVWGVLGGPRQLVSVNRRLPGVHLLLDRASFDVDFDEVVVSVPDADRLVQAIGAMSP